MNNIKKLRQEHHQTASELGKAIGRSQPTVSKWENSRHLKYEDAKKIADYYRIPVYEVMGESAESYTEVPASLKNIICLPIIDSGESFSDSSPETAEYRQFISQDLFKKISPVSAENIKIFIIHGDAMSPTLNENDMVWIDISATKPIGNGLYLFAASNQVFIKRLCFNEFTSAVSLISDNPLYPPIPVEQPKQLQILGKVIGIHKILF